MYACSLDYKQLIPFQLAYFPEYQPLQLWNLKIILRLKIAG